MQFLDFNPKTSDYKTVHFLYHMVQTVQGSKYGTVPSNTVQLAGLIIWTSIPKVRPMSYSQ